MTIDSSIKKGIISSLIGSVIFISILSPLSKLIWNIIQLISDNWYANFSNKLYKNAAFGHRNEIDFVLLTIALSALFIIYLVSFFIFTQKYHDREHRIKLDKANSENEKIKLFDREIKRKNRTDWILNHSGKFIFYFGLGYIFVGGYVFASNLFVSYTDLQLNTSFNQRLTIIEPYIENTEVKILKSKWALMNTRKDFEEINLRIEDIAKVNNIELPKLLLK